MNSEFAPGILIGTLSMFPHGLAAHDPQYALTLAFTALVLFQFFNVFNARAEKRSAFNVSCFAKGKLWQALAAMLALQVLVVHGGERRNQSPTSTRRVTDSSRTPTKEAMNDHEKAAESSIHRVSDDPLVRRLQASIRHAARILAVLMVLVIWWGVADVVYVLYSRVSTHPYYLLEISDILATFGAFMAVLIAIEVFVNIISYLDEGGLQLDIVLATAYMAVLRKIIILDYKEISPEYVYATAALAIALALGYWLSRTQQQNHLPARAP
ncbi:MAG: phosphate-starvation-inducible PsiE family protein [Candidatus Accumulibacter sp.]|uniref:Phosphate-starvation-inducible PsiE family protein n=4 Tax=Candidatus Accumulibacter TaxID=327159 RepID=A0A7D5SNJ5_9PROT|nr:phosphate-starvation-inducible PsiE family protein [Accumulibacter sp.]QLH50381.1 MAG: phosphate-starvation-inducible PsiE family protein [Candidatus Accumulibacter cognatus]MBN8518804.1 phosphate-starvation-inducible PsiE family protein [Accumulibacter sp.]MBO3711969.1 phosphate-starvation-inducible PsiE family protein [Accumulibacter sp.]MCM8580383.1 phosphate-starvation-inducible PsiE family protein [Accumulibacter sp.]MCM8622510.1 phosphate-starvation-inducible PsiE family protein [Accu